MITEVDPQGKITSITYPTGITESMTYDDEGRLFTRTDGYGNSSTIIYDEATGYVKEVEGVEGSSLSVDYDETGNVKSISDNSIDADTTGSSVSAGDAQYEYYDDGSLKSSTIDGKKTVFTYTEEGLLASEEKVEVNQIYR